MELPKAIQRVIDGASLSSQEMTDVMRKIMTGEATPAQIGGFLVGLRMKGESVDEIAAAAGVMRELAQNVEVDATHLVDTCGTGGDGSNLFNVSTACAFVVAAAGGKVAKHGNRSVSSSCGSADVLETAGVRIDLSPEQVARCIEEVGVGFMFAPLHHGAMKHAIGPRKEMGVRTIFNVLGPLTNPASAPHQVMGVFSDKWLRPIAEVLHQLGSRHVLVVHSEDGLDEISLAAPTHVAELREGQIHEYRVEPEQFGLQRASLSELQVATAEESLACIQQALDKKASAASDLVAMNAGAAIYACGLADSLAEGVSRAQDAIGSGVAKAKLDELVSFTGLMKETEES